MKRLVQTLPMVLATALVVAACDKGQRAAVFNTFDAHQLNMAEKDSAIRAKDSVLAEKVHQLDEQNAIIGDAATSARMVTEIDRTLSQVRALRVSRSNRVQRPEIEGRTMAEQLDLVGRKVHAVIARLESTQARIQRLRAQTIAHTAEDSARAGQLAEYEASIAELRSTAERQQQEITQLTERLDGLQRANTTLVMRETELTAREDSVYVAIGTEQDLLQRGLIRKEGGTKLLFGRGKTLVASRNVRPEDFRVLSRANDLTIPLPNPGKEYRIVSRQNLAYAEARDEHDGKVKGAITITDAAAFWAPSKFLILVEQ